ncbi:MAG: hypothetical protein ACMUIU_15615 [bacterium]
MEERIQIVSLILIVFLILLPKEILSLSVKVTGSWSETIDNMDLQGGAGSDLINSYESVSNVCDIDITGIPKDNWRLDVSKVDIQWHPNFHLYVKRTSDGTNGGSLLGGTTYQEITDVYKTFFSGSDNVRNITIQYQLTGVSIQIPPNIYSTTIYYTVTKN